MRARANLNNMKKLFRSDKDRIIAGIFGGLGEYLDIDPVLLRLGWLLITVFTGFIPGIIAYAVAILIIPRRPIKTSPKSEEKIREESADEGNEHSEA